jgi:hypothetical protein
MKKIILAITIIISLNAQAQTPEIYSWIRNTTGALGYNNIPSNVQSVYYTANDVYVSATCIPAYSIGPWTANPNIPVNKNFVFKITRNPSQNTGTSTATGLGHTGVWTNGVSIFNAKDGMSYNNAGVWNRDALYYEGISFDNCLGHPAPGGEYHHHVNPTCLYDDTDSLNHSPIIGYAFDGFPIYGAYGFTNTNGTGPIKRMQSSFQLSTATTRTNGPAVSTTYPAGCFIEDNIYVAGSGDLDNHNGRFCVTPDYPLGTYAYFVTINANLYPVYPYTAGPTYYGVVQPGNTGPMGGNNTIPGTAVQYTGSVGLAAINNLLDITISPNPANDNAVLRIGNIPSNNIQAVIYSMQGKVVQTLNNLVANEKYAIDLSTFVDGNYLIRVTADQNQQQLLKLIKSSK